jgi:hypothetical protein
VPNPILGTQKQKHFFLLLPLPNVAKKGGQIIEDFTAVGEA